MLCIISSGTENFFIVKLCQLYAIPYEVIADTIAWPYDDKEHDYLIQRVKDIIELHQEKNKESLYVVSPSIELGLFLHDDIFSQKNIFPLFSSYLSYCFAHSHSGRLWLLWWWSDLTHIEEYIKSQSDDYTKSSNQIKTKKFLFPFALRNKEVPIWNYLLRLLSPRQVFVNKLIKEDLKYFKDANVDTIIPLHYSYFRIQRTIQWFFNQKKQVFHGRDIIKKIFLELSSTSRLIRSENEKIDKVEIFHSWSVHFIQEKKREYMLSGWGKYNLNYERIDLK